MKKLTLERVVPIIFAIVSWLIRAITVSGLSSFPKLASRLARMLLLDLVSTPALCFRQR